MNKRIKSLLIAAALTLPILAATTATAGPNCGKLPPDHPQCLTTPTVPVPDHPEGLTCAQEVYGGYDEWLTLTNGTYIDGTDEHKPLVVGSGRLCIDWTTTKATEWLVTVTDPGAAKSVFMSLRDSHPGDFCWRGVIDVKRGDTDVTMAHTNGAAATDSVIPISAMDACGVEYTDSAAPYVLIIELGGKPTTASITIEPSG
jgi:hypothetical protein